MNVSPSVRNCSTRMVRYRCDTVCRPQWMQYSVAPTLIKQSKSTKNAQESSVEWLMFSLSLFLYHYAIPFWMQYVIIVRATVTGILNAKTFRFIYRFSIFNIDNRLWWTLFIYLVGCIEPESTGVLAILVLWLIILVKSIF